MTEQTLDLADLSVRPARTDELAGAELRAIRALLEAAFAPDDPSFPESDWLHALGGLHVIARLGGAIVSHASVVERVLWASDYTVSRAETGYSWAHTLHYLLEWDELSETEKEWLLGRSARQILRWPTPDPGR